MKRAAKFVLAPTRGQHNRLALLLAHHCDLYNACLTERRLAFQTTDYATTTVKTTAGERAVKRTRVGRGTSITYSTQSAQLKEIRAHDNDYSQWGYSAQQATVRRVNRSYENFYRRVKAGQTPGYPRYKPYRRFNTVLFPTNGDGAKWDSTPQDRLRFYIQGVGHVKVRAHRDLPEDARIKTLAVSREGLKWFVVVTFDTDLMRDLAPTGKIVGIDMGVNPSFLITSDGEHYEAPKFYRTAETELAQLQAARDRAQHGSANRRRLSRRIARLHGKVRRQRLDYHHKTALRLVRDHDIIAHEALKPANMSKKPKPKPDPNTPGEYLPNGAAAKGGLNKSILDSGWSQFLTILAAKAEEAGREIVGVNPAYTSQSCEVCTEIDPASRSGRGFACTSCGHVTDADEQAARTVLRLGLESLQAEAASAA